MNNHSKVKITSDDTAQKLSTKLSTLDIEKKEEDVKKKAEEQGLEYINLDKFPIAQDALKVISRNQTEALETICILYTGDEMRLGSLNPTNPQVAKLVKELSDSYHVHVKIYLISKYSFEKALKVYDKIPKVTHVEGVSLTAEDLKQFDDKLQDFNTLNKLIKETSLTETINLIIAASLKFSSSDIHIEAEEDEIKVRFRIDGVLHNVASLPKESWDQINSRLKLLSGLKLNIGNKPQDGRFTISLAKDSVDVRVSSIPSSFGESIVMRLLKSSSIGLKFEDLGVKGKSFNDLNNEIKKPNGMIITTGPTGSGKTTTLYAILNKLNDEETKIITLEDPIEYKLKGIVQSQVDSAELAEGKKGEKKQTARYTFAKGLRSILRQDPDVVMVGEIRDLETAETAINAALTGHLMLSTLHTNSAAGAIPRFLAMGVQPFLLAPALNSIIGQRLVRRLCDCKEENKEVDNKTMTDILNALKSISSKSGHKIEDMSNLKFYKAKGCEKCHNLGYKGRVGIYEIFTMSPEIEKMILSGKVSEYDIEKEAVDSGMITMLQDGLLKAREGLTSIEEVFDKVKN